MTIVVNGVSIADHDVLTEMQHHPAPAREQALTAAAEALIVRELLRQRASQLGLLDHRDDDPEVEERALASLIERETSSPVADEEALRRYYEANRAKFRTPALFEASHILLATAGTDRTEAKALALKLIEVLNSSPEAFANLAAAHSACSSSCNGGGLGQIGEGEVAPELETFLRELEEGQLCPVPVETEFGFHVLRLDRRWPSQQLDFDTARPRVRSMLERLSRQRSVAQYIALLAGESQIEGYAFRAADSPLLQ
jgi:peptidyl-prolyl cis-trans isomerase C